MGKRQLGESVKEGVGVGEHWRGRLMVGGEKGGYQGSPGEGLGKGWGGNGEEGRGAVLGIGQLAAFGSGIQVRRFSPASACSTMNLPLHLVIVF